MRPGRSLTQWLWGWLRGEAQQLPLVGAFVATAHRSMFRATADEALFEALASTSRWRAEAR